MQNFDTDHLDTYDEVFPIVLTDPTATEQRYIDWYAWGSIIPLTFAWLWLNHTTVQWLIRLPQQISRVNLLFLLGIFFLCIGHWVFHRERFAIQFGLNRSPLVMLFGSAIAAIGLRWCFDLDTLQAACFALGSYGLIGLAMPPTRWKQGLPFVAAITLGFSIALGPLPRSLITEILERLLAPFHTQSITSENILVLESGIAFIDLPCSGRRSFLTGSLFLIAATVLERRQTGWRWLGIFVTNLGLLLTANVLRILTLVVLTYVLNQPAIADIIHVPFGLISFVTVCIISWVLLQFIPQDQPKPHRPIAPNSPRSLKSWVVIFSCMLGLSLIPSPATVAFAPNLFADLSLNQNIALQTIPLTPYEREFFTRHPGVVAEKKSFDLNGISGSMLFVVSPHWEAHHAPELCLTGSGDRVSHMERREFTAQITGRWLSLNEGQRNAAYWFQSPTRTTDQYLDRLWSEITRQEHSWTLISILFDQSVDPETVRPLLTDIHDAVESKLSATHYLSMALHN